MTPSIRIEHDLEMTTRDGLTLRADVWRPDVEGPVPAIVIRTPYDKTANHSMLFPPVAAARAGFAVVIQDVRARFASDGDEWPASLDLWACEGDDGEDTLDWVASMPWCDGSLGMFGHSYLAEVQYALAARRPPRLKAIAPAMHAFTKSGIRQVILMLEPIMLTYAAGMALDTLQRKLPTGEATFDDLVVALQAIEDPAGACEHLPISEHPLFSLPGVRTYAELQEVTSSIFATGTGRGEREIDVPALMTTGWFDSQQGGAEMFRLLRTVGTPAAREHSRLIIGPWSHTSIADFTGEWGNSMLGAPAAIRTAQMHADFFRRHLLGDTDAPDLPRVRYFVMGANQWRTADDWPLPATDFRPMYLRSHGHANSERGDGALSWDPPGPGDQADRFTYDPHDPVPSVGGHAMYTGGSTLAGPFNQTRVERRDDVLVYTSEPLRQPVEVVGPVTARLWVSSTAPDTDVVAKLCDVAPDGVSVNVADGIFRLSWLVEDGELTELHAGEVHAVDVDLQATGHQFRPGHAIRISVASCAFPLWQRHMNTAADPGTVAKGVVAIQTVLHDADHPSHVLLPVQPL